MNRSERHFALLAVVAALLAALATCASARAQFGGGGGGGIGNSGANGVVVDAQGVLRLQTYPDPGGQLVKKRINDARAHLHPDIARPSKLRHVSLNRLEAALGARLQQGERPTDEMAYLAGITRVRYVFFYPESRDIVLAGPSEGWAADASGRVLGIESGRPVLQLQDLAVALRAFPPGPPVDTTILCSIDPTEEGLARLQQFWRSVGSQISPADTQLIVNGMRTSLGMQNIRIGGIAANTHFAQVLLECDYRMKLIGIGLEQPPVKIASFVDRAKPTNGTSSLERWYFIPDYDCVRVAADRLGLQLVGDGVRLVSEQQFVGNDGSRLATAKVSRASEVFTHAFTQKYAELAVHLPVYAEMRNLIDLAIVAAFINQQDFYAQADWRATTFNDEKALPVETFVTPLQVESVCTAVIKGNRLFTPIGGGVTIRPRQALRPDNTLPDADGQLSGARESVDLKDVPADRWWWD